MGARREQAEDSSWRCRWAWGNTCGRWLAGAVLLTACQSESAEQVGTEPWGMTDTENGSGGGTEGGADDDSTGSSGTGDSGEAADCDAGPHVSSDDLVRLTVRQYDATVRDLLGVDLDVARASFSADILLDLSGDSKFRMGAPVSPLVAKQLMLGSEAIADAVDVDALTASCDGGDACVEAFIDDISARGFRRPATAAELDALRAIYDGEGAHEDGARAVVEAVLQSPQFIYLLIPDTGGAAPGEVVQLDNYATASRLSYFVWGTMPDAALFEAAGAGSLTDLEGLEAQLDRMLADPRAKDGVLEFYDAVVDLDFVESVTKNPASYPEFTTEIAHDLHTSLKMGLEALHFEEDGTLADLASGMPFYVNDTLGAYYGVDAAVGGDFEAVSAVGGLLSHPAMASLLAKPTDTAIVERGQFVRASLLCNPLPPPPPGVEAEFPQGDASTTPREKFEQHRADPACAGCHDLIDPIGYAMEPLDGDGRTRTHYAGGQEIDASGDFLVGPETYAFNNLTELEGYLATEPMYEQCMVEHWLSFATRRVPGDLDECTLADITARVQEADGSLSELVRATVLSDGFRFVSAGNE